MNPWKVLWFVNLASCACLGTVTIFVATAIITVIIIAIPIVYWDRIERARGRAIRQEAMQQVYIGMARKEAQESIEGAWRHYECPERDVYLFGSRNLDQAANISINYQTDVSQENQTVQVTHTLDSSVVGFYNHCLIIEQ